MVFTTIEYTTLGHRRPHEYLFWIILLGPAQIKVIGKEFPLPKLQFVLFLAIGDLVTDSLTKTKTKTKTKTLEVT